ncbi:hypothetical protein BGZ88_000800 [Linnemannia elongata]|nr:hypothetical protein BGZ88_000800 [Linnemannia elongata]
MNFEASEIDDEIEPTQTNETEDYFQGKYRKRVMEDDDDEIEWTDDEEERDQPPHSSSTLDQNRPTQVEQPQTIEDIATEESSTIWISSVADVFEDGFEVGDTNLSSGMDLQAYFEAQHQDREEARAWEEAFAFEGSPPAAQPQPLIFELLSEDEEEDEN